MQKRTVKPNRKIKKSDLPKLDVNLMFGRPFFAVRCGADCTVRRGQGWVPTVGGLYGETAAWGRLRSAPQTADNCTGGIAGVRCGATCKLTCLLSSLLHFLLQAILYVAVFFCIRKEPGICPALFG